MALRSFSQWKKLNEGRRNRGRKETDCPRPKDPEFCRKWNLYLNGQGPDPLAEEKKKERHGPTEAKIDSPAAKNVYRRKQREGEGRFKNPFTRGY